MVLWYGLKLEGMLFLELLKKVSCVGQGQPLFVPGLGPPYRRYKVICGLLLTVLGLKVLGRGYAVN